MNELLTRLDDIPERGAQLRLAALTRVERGLGEVLLQQRLAIGSGLERIGAFGMKFDLS